MYAQWALAAIAFGSVAAANANLDRSLHAEQFLVVGYVATFAVALWTGRWYPLALPWAGALAGYLMSFAVDPDCGECGEYTREGVVILFALYFASTITVIGAVGVLIHRGVRRALRLGARRREPQ